MPAWAACPPALSRAPGSQPRSSVGRSLPSAAEAPASLRGPFSRQGDEKGLGLGGGEREGGKGRERRERRLRLPWGTGDKLAVISFGPGQASHALGLGH